MKIKQKLNFSLLLAGLAFVSSPVYGSLVIGDTIGIDFGGTPPVAGSNFNHYSDVVILDGVTESFGGTLINTAGNNVTGVGFSVANNTGDDSFEIGGGAEGTGLMTDPTIYTDGLISNDNNGGRLTDGDAVIDGIGDRAHFVLTFTGLDDGLDYNLTGGFDNRAGSGNNNFAAIWQADGQSISTNPLVNSVGYVTLNGLSTDGAGNLVINVVRQNNLDGRHVTVAGLTLNAIPEPGSLLTFGMASFLGLSVRRRKRR